MIDLRPACTGMTGLLEGFEDAELASATPCSEYTVRDLVAHIDVVAQGFTAVARKVADDDASGDAPVTVSPGGAWRDPVVEHVRALGVAWTEPTAWQDNSFAAGLELPNAVWGRIALTELVVHGWDLAHATGQTLHVPEETLSDCFAHVSEFLPNAPIKELWGPPVEMAADAALLDRIVALTGRAP
ncbi:TIGR03086 family metal-binding protein [Streptomyces sp. 8N114]|uniref:TIGR03086 family metal-binding protein n=1 Tax=Streptomyces sp. 8N114 TaxID=3457419 RepID=UPI003FD2BF64